LELDEESIDSTSIGGDGVDWEGSWDMMSGIEPGRRPSFVIFMDALDIIMNSWSAIVGNLIGAVPVGCRIQYDSMQSC